MQDKQKGKQKVTETLTLTTSHIQIGHGLLYNHPRNQNHNISCFDPINSHEFSGETKLGFSQRKGSDFIVGSKSVLSVVEVLESDGSERHNRNVCYDAIVIGSGIGGLVAATQLAVKGARVLVLEKYVIPGGSSGFYQRDGYTFDVGSSVMFGFSDKVSLITNIPIILSLIERILGSFWICAISNEGFDTCYSRRSSSNLNLVI